MNGGPYSSAAGSKGDDESRFLLSVYSQDADKTFTLSVRGSLSLKVLRKWIENFMQHRFPLYPPPFVYLLDGNRMESEGDVSGNGITVDSVITVKTVDSLSRSRGVLSGSDFADELMKTLSQCPNVLSMFSKVLQYERYPDYSLLLQKLSSTLSSYDVDMDEMARGVLSLSLSSSRTAELLHAESFSFLVNWLLYCIPGRPPSFRVESLDVLCPAMEVFMDNDNLLFQIIHAISLCTQADCTSLFSQVYDKLSVNQTSSFIYAAISRYPENRSGALDGLRIIHSFVQNVPTWYTTFDLSSALHTMNTTLLGNNQSLELILSLLSGMIATHKPSLDYLLNHDLFGLLLSQLAGTDSHIVSLLLDFITTIISNKMARRVVCITGGASRLVKCARSFQSNQSIIRNVLTALHCLTKEWENCMFLINLGLIDVLSTLLFTHFKSSEIVNGAFVLVLALCQNCEYSRDEVLRTNFLSKLSECKSNHLFDENVSMNLCDIFAAAASSDLFSYYYEPKAVLEQIDICNNIFINHGPTHVREVIKNAQTVVRSKEALTESQRSSMSKQRVSAPKRELLDPVSPIGRQFTKSTDRSRPSSLNAHGKLNKHGQPITLAMVTAANQSISKNSDSEFEAVSEDLDMFSLILKKIWDSADENRCLEALSALHKLCGNTSSCQWLATFVRFHVFPAVLSIAMKRYPNNVYIHKISLVILKCIASVTRSDGSVLSQGDTAEVLVSDIVHFAACYDITVPATKIIYIISSNVGMRGRLKRLGIAQALQNLISDVTSSRIAELVADGTMNAGASLTKPRGNDPRSEVVKNAKRIMTNLGLNEEAVEDGDLESILVSTILSTLGKGDRGTKLQILDALAVLFTTDYHKIINCFLVQEGVNLVISQVANAVSSPEDRDKELVSRGMELLCIISDSLVHLRYLDFSALDVVCINILRIYVDTDNCITPTIELLCNMCQLSTVPPRLAKEMHMFINLIQSNKQNSSLMDKLVVIIFSIIQSSSENCALFVAVNGVGLIIALMKQNTNRIPLLYNCCCILIVIAKDPQHSHVLVNTGTTDLCLRLATSNTSRDDHAFVAKAVSAVSALLGASVEIVREFCSRQGFNHLISIMDACVNDAPIQYSCISLIRTLSLSKQVNREIISFGLVRRLIKTLINYERNDKDIVMMCLATMKVLTGDRDCIDVIINNQGVNTLMDCVIVWRDDVSVSEYLFQILYSLAQINEGFAGLNTKGNYNYLSDLRGCFAESEGLECVCVLELDRLLKLLDEASASHTPVNQKTTTRTFDNAHDMRNLGFLDKAIQSPLNNEMNKLIMIDSASESTIGECLNSIISLASRSELKDELMNYGASSMIVAALKRFPRSPSVVSASLRLLHYLFPNYLDSPSNYETVLQSLENAIESDSIINHFGTISLIVQFLNSISTDNAVYSKLSSSTMISRLTDTCLYYCDHPPQSDSPTNKMDFSYEDMSDDGNTVHSLTIPNTPSDALPDTMAIDNGTSSASTSNPQSDSPEYNIARLITLFIDMLYNVATKAKTLPDFNFSELLVRVMYFLHNSNVLLLKMDLVSRTMNNGQSVVRADIELCTKYHLDNYSSRVQFDGAYRRAAATEPVLSEYVVIRSPLMPTVIEEIRSLMDNIANFSRTCHIIRAVAGVDENRNEFISFGGVNLLVNAYETNENRETALLFSQTVLSLVSEHEDNSDFMTYALAVSLIRILKQNSADSTLCTVVLTIIMKCLNNLSDVSVLINCNFVTEFVQAVVSIKHDGDIVIIILSILRHLLDSDRFTTVSTDSVCALVMDEVYRGYAHPEVKNILQQLVREHSNHPLVYSHFQQYAPRTMLNIFSTSIYNNRSNAEATSLFIAYVSDDDCAKLITDIGFFELLGPLLRSVSAPEYIISILVVMEHLCKFEYSCEHFLSNKDLTQSVQQLMLQSVIVDERFKQSSSSLVETIINGYTGNPDLPKFVPDKNISIPSPNRPPPPPPIGSMPASPSYKTSRSAPDNE